MFCINNVNLQSKVVSKCSAVKSPVFLSQSGVEVLWWIPQTSADQDQAWEPVSNHINIRKYWLGETLSAEPQQTNISSVIMKLKYSIFFPLLKFPQMKQTKGHEYERAFNEAKVNKACWGEQGKETLKL